MLPNGQLARNFSHLPIFIKLVLIFNYSFVEGRAHIPVLDIPKFRDDLYNKNVRWVHDKDFIDMNCYAQVKQMYIQSILELVSLDLHDRLNPHQTSYPRSHYF